ncbi:MAG: alpha/beta hydrolase [Clostridiales bacterium]|nr:alpha/beta hydrolase [Clostridiales bacterium]
MNFESIDVKKEFEYFDSVAPRKTIKILGKDFTYRYYKNPDPKVDATMLMLAGGSGLGDAFAGMARAFTEKYSLINFNYPLGFTDNEAMADAIAELIKNIGATNVYLWGQSYGGALAQIIAKKHPEVVKGLILTSTASMTGNLRYEGMKCLVNMFSEEKEKKDIKTYKKLPMSLLPVLLNLAFKVKMKDNPAGQRVVKDFIDYLKPDLTREYFIHMTRLLCDLRNHLGTHRKEDFEYLRGRILVIEPEDDDTFTADVKEGLINDMPDPVVNREISGGHLAMMFDTDNFIDVIDRFMSEQK